jgi:7-cyano-7-deazaguanine reductase
MSVAIHGEGVLGRQIKGALRQLDTFDLPPSTTRVVYTSDEVTSLCPITGQPDWYTAKIILTQPRLGIESKSLKLYLQSFRDDGAFCEAFADIIAKDVSLATKAGNVQVVLHQKSRGGVTIESTSSIWQRTGPRSRCDDDGEGGTQQDVSLRSGTPPSEPLRQVP